MKKRAKICFYVFIFCAFCALGILGYFVFNSSSDNVMVGSRKFVTFNEVPGAASYSLSVSNDKVDANTYVANYKVEKSSTAKQNEYSFKIEVLANDGTKLAQENYIQEVTSENLENNTIDCIIKNYTVDFFSPEGEVISTRKFNDQTLTNYNKKFFCCTVSEYFEDLFVQDGKYCIEFVAVDEEGQQIENSYKKVDYNYYAYYKNDFIRRPQYFINGVWYDYVIDNKEELEKIVWHTILYRNNNVTFYVNTKTITPGNINGLVFDAINNYPEYNGLNEKSTYAKMGDNVGSLINFTYYLKKDFTDNYVKLKEKSENVYNKAIDYLTKKDNKYLIDYCKEDVATERTFDIDAINASNEVLVENTEQLFMVVQYGAKPVFKDETCVAKTVYDNARQVLKQINNSDNLSDYEKALNIYRYICGNVNYDWVTYKFMENYGNSYVSTFGNYNCFYLEGVLLDLQNQYAVCDGLSKAYVLMCNIEGIDCVKVNSSDHAWNNVYLFDSDLNLNGWYGVDTTWGMGLYKQAVAEPEEGYDYFEFLTHTYFLNVEVADRDIEFSSGVEEELSDYSYYKVQKYTSNSQTKDFYIENDAELTDVFGYARKYLQGAETSYVLEIQFDFAYQYDDNFDAYALTSLYLIKSQPFITQEALEETNQKISSWFSKYLFNNYNYEWFLLDDVLMVRIFE